MHQKRKKFIVIFLYWDSEMQKIQNQPIVQEKILDQQPME